MATRFNFPTAWKCNCGRGRHLKRAAESVFTFVPRAPLATAAPAHTESRASARVQCDPTPPASDSPTVRRIASVQTAQDAGHGRMSAVPILGCRRCRSGLPLGWLIRQSKRTSKELRDGVAAADVCRALKAVSGRRTPFAVESLLRQRSSEPREARPRGQKRAVWLYLSFERGCFVVGMGVNFPITVSGSGRDQPGLIAGFDPQ